VRVPQYGKLFHRSGWNIVAMGVREDAGSKGPIDTGIAVDRMSRKRKRAESAPFPFGRSVLRKERLKLKTEAQNASSPRRHCLTYYGSIDERGKKEKKRESASSKSMTRSVGYF